jgi:hypothetical protein
VVRAVPVVHCVEEGVGLVDRDHRAFCDDAQIGVGDDAGDLQDGARLRIQPRHLEVDPDEVRVARFGHRIAHAD